ncbi:hypothetical protein EJ04DRAFT_582424 [Polyplosphaeria fusca]|uniref:Uncharacterized protein n=1 Tax=Polyplosphaeria fusca TaxID=682080 RepID=A0A9P4UVK2_9PLEO|nr:hypothetical protein EJ04DRAFT_582424 [Polyplosphaeria fusca]
MLRIPLSVVKWRPLVLALTIPLALALTIPLALAIARTLALTDNEFADLIAAAQNLEASKPRLVTEDDIRRHLLPESFKVHQHIMKLWNRFSVQILRQTPIPESPFKDVPMTEQIKLFLQWILRVCRGRLEVKITDVTLNNQLSNLKRAVKLYPLHQYTKYQSSKFQKAVHLRILTATRTSFDES